MKVNCIISKCRVDRVPQLLSRLEQMNPCFDMEFDTNSTIQMYVYVFECSIIDKDINVHCVVSDEVFGDIRTIKFALYE